MNKNIKAALVVCLLALFPAISYIYLKRGFEFQKSNFAQLETKVKLDTELAYQFPYDSCLDKVNMVIFLEDLNRMAQHMEMIQGLEKQYTKIPKYLGVVYAHERIKPPEMDMRKFQWIGVPQDLWEEVGRGFSMENFQNDDGMALILDVQNNIRNSYDLTDPEDLKEIVAHASLLFPKQKRKR